MHPQKLKDDSIIEAICHFQFQTAELPEIVIGRLTDVEAWKGFTQTRLPVSDIPAPIRAHDENLRYEPTIQLCNADNSRLVRIGGNVISYHIVGKYCGWESYQPELDIVINALIEKIEGVSVIRCGFRYLNALTKDRHHVENLHSLSITLEVAGANLLGPVNLNFLIQNSDTHQTLTRIASPYFVKGTIPETTVAVVDVDVFTLPGFETSDSKQLSKWVEDAHNFEKDAFFSLIPEDAIAKLVET